MQGFGGQPLLINLRAESATVLNCMITQGTFFNLIMLIHELRLSSEKLYVLPST